VLLTIFSCTSKKINNGQVCSLSLTTHDIHPQFGIEIGLPSSWSTVDTLIVMPHKHLVDHKTIYNMDSTSRAFIQVLDFKNDEDRAEDTLTLKSKLESYASFMEDSILAVEVKQINGWNIVFQKTIKTKNNAMQGGHILCCKDNKDVEVRFQTLSKDSLESANVISCIMESFVIRN
jgi:hypothetical protein